MRPLCSSIAPGIFLLSLPSTSAHSRWSCPEARSSDTGIKAGPCGDETEDFDGPLMATSTAAGGDDDSVLAISPGPMRVTFEESVHHTGAPFRISLSSDGSDYDSCVLLDHIPHNDCCSPSLSDPSTYTPYTITINIPNVLCERCSLHLSNPMTDKIGSDGSPSGIGCTDPGTCFSVYHSCTRPFRIVGDVSDGAVPRSEYTCPSLESINVGWPTSWTGDNGEAAQASIPGVYRRISAVWSADDYTLTTAPEAYREDTGDSCRYGSQIASSYASSTVPEVPESEAAEMWDIESAANGTAEASVHEGETAVTPNEPPRTRAPSSAQRGVTCLNYLFAISFVVEIALLN
ncbi:hypothetical protein ACHAW5_000308 [Stephanodiscus triporus]|uniref:Chitin-binding type-4 domain-containing protein n=1 Tax=Stephanodiscus triporus TaxID=2934178 RepID=A0ABD3MR10_9STRA